MPSERTCLGCRRVAAKAKLVRLARSPEGRVTVDADGRAGGRGAYLCPRRECWETARRRRVLPGALRVPAGQLADDAIERDLRSVWRRSEFTS